MFMLSMGAGMGVGLPDACKTPLPAGPIPIPYPNLASSAMCPTAVMNVITGGTPTINLMSSAMLSSGDEAGALTGLISQGVKGQTNWMLGSLSVMVGGMPAQRLTSMGGCNSMPVAPNGPSVCLVPSQIKVLVLL